MKNQFINRYEINNEEVLNEFKTFEHYLIKTIQENQQSATGSNVNVSMNMLDATQFVLSKSDTVNKDTEFGIVNEETLINEEHLIDKNETDVNNEESKKKM